MTSQRNDRKRTKDNVFEKKREEHLSNVANIEAQISKLRQRISLISDEVRHLTASDTQLSAREELKGDKLKFLELKRIN